MTEIRPSILKAATVLLLCSAPGISQTPPQPQSAPAAQAAPQAQLTQPALPKQLPNFYRNLIVIDPAHGGTDRGARLTGGTAEKDVTLAFAQRLRPALVAQGFTVVSTRDSDPADVLPSDQRAGTANHARPLACLLLHAAATGSGVHIATSALDRSRDGSSRVLRWSDAQAGMLDMSLRLANEIGLTLSNAHLPVVMMRASVPPIDNLTCAATLIEIAPLAPSGGSRSAVTDVAYQQHIAEAIALGLSSFRTHNAPAPSFIAAPPTSSVPVRPIAAPSANSTAPAPATKPAPARPQATAIPSGGAFAPAKPKVQTQPAHPPQKQGAPR